MLSKGSVTHVIISVNICAFYKHTCLLKHYILSGMSFFPSPVLSTSAGLAEIQQEATLCLSDLDEWLSDSTELGNHIHIWQPTRHKGERPPPFIIYFKENIMVRWFALSVINNNPPPLNSALMHIKKCSGRSSLELILGLLGLKKKTSALSLNDTKELMVTVELSWTLWTPLKVLDWVGRTFKSENALLYYEL